MHRYQMKSVFLITVEHRLSELPINRIAANNEPTPSHSEAFNCVEIAMKWYEKQDGCSAAQHSYTETLSRLITRETSFVS
jgi:hypothetical protein